MAEETRAEASIEAGAETATARTLADPQARAETGAAGAGEAAVEGSGVMGQPDARFSAFGKIVAALAVRSSASSRSLLDFAKVIGPRGVKCFYCCLQ
jgi:hypothetical protein